MKKLLLSTSILACLGMLLMVSSCKKKEKDETDTTLDPQAKQHNEDNNYYKLESDQANDDINNSIQDYSVMNGKPEHWTPTMKSVLSSPLCGVTIDTSQLSSKTLIFNFDGVTPCFSPSRTRGGQIVVRLTTGTYWKDAGSILTITYNNFKVTRLVDNLSINFNGTKTLKNVNGNDWLGFLAGTGVLKYQERALNIAVTINNNLNATWNSARITEWRYNTSNSSIGFTAYGDTTVNGFSNVDSWGTNRYGYAFTTYYNAPINSNTYCGLWRPNSGDLTHHVNNNDFRITLGLDQQGNPTPYACAYGFKVSWTGPNGSASVILTY